MPWGLQTGEAIASRICYHRHSNLYFCRVRVICFRGNLYTLTAVLPESEVVDGQGAAPLIAEIMEGFIVQPE